MSIPANRGGESQLRSIDRSSKSSQTHQRILEDKISKLQAATDDAEGQLKKHKQALEDSQKRVDAAKAMFKQIPEDEQNKILITDTKLPELLEMHAIAKEEYETSETRYETNQRYLDVYKEKAETLGD